MSKGNSRRDVATDLKRKRTYLRDLEKKRWRQPDAVADTDEELTIDREEIAELERRLQRSLREAN
ncbi:MAG: hypothetical protein GWP16_02550 [Nitrospirae bacterium]|nr:hypothetical protein [Nitrospirota bacterium]